MSSLAFLVTELQSLASETRRKHPEVREAAEKSLAILRASPEQATANLAVDGPQSDDLLRPVFMGCATKNAKVVAISLGSLQRLIALKAVPQSAVTPIINTMSDAMSQGVDIQLRILQTLVSLVMNFPDVHGERLGDALLLCFKLHESRIAVVSSTAAATLRQLVMFVVDKMVEEDKRDELDPHSLSSIHLPDGSTKFLSPSALDAFSVFEDLCLLANAERPRFLRLETLQKTFALELIESVLTNYHKLFRQHHELIILLQHHLCPLLLRSLSERPIFPLTLRCTRVVFLLLKQFSNELVTESEVFLMLLIRIITEDGPESGYDLQRSSSQHAQGGAQRPPWMRVLAMEVMRGLCTDAELVRNFWDRYDAQEDGSKVFTSLITALKRLITEKPALLGVCAQMQGVGVQSSFDHGSTAGYGLDVGGMAGRVATAASATVSGVVGMMGSSGGLSLQGSSMKLQCIDQLDKAESPPIPESYIYLLAVQCLVSLCDGLAQFTGPLYTSLVVQKPRSTGSAGESSSSTSSSMKAPPALDISTLPQGEPSTHHLRIVRAIIENGWPALLAALSFIISTNLSDDLFVEVLSSYQALTTVAGMLGLNTPRDALLTSLAKLAVPTRVVSSLDTYTEPPTPSRSASTLSESLGLSAGGPPGLSERNMACLRVLVQAAGYLAGSLGESWFGVLEVLQNADYVLTARGGASPSGAGGGLLPGMSGGNKRNSSLFGAGGGMTPSRSNSSMLSASGSQQGQSQQQQGGAGGTNAQMTAPRHPMLADLDGESLLSAIQRLFDASRNLEDGAYKDFTNALCRLSAEMVGMQTSAVDSMGGEPEPVDDNIGSAGLLTPTQTDAMHRRRVSGIHIPRTLRSGDFGITKLGHVSMLNIHRLIYRAPEVAWNTTTTHLLSIVRLPFAPHPIRVQAARVLDDILIVVPRNLTSATDIRADVQRRVLDVLASQVVPDPTLPGGISYTATNVELRRMGLETLHQILQASGHTLVVGWEIIFQMLESVCRPPSSSSGLSTWSMSSDSLTSHPPSPQKQKYKPAALLGMGLPTEKSYTALVKIAFMSLTLVCDSVSTLAPEHLRLCISTLGQFGRQADTNIALTAAASLLWSVSDAIQAKRKEVEDEPEYSQLWMFLLAEVLGLCTDERAEVRDGAIQTLFRTVQLYGSTLSLEIWEDCVWKVVFPLLDELTVEIRRVATSASASSSGGGNGSLLTPPPPGLPSSLASAQEGVSQVHAWDESKVLALSSLGSIWHDFLVPNLMHMESFEKAWDVFVDHITESVLLDNRPISAPALRCLEKAIKAAIPAVSPSPGAPEELHPKISALWQRVWVAIDTLGSAILKRASGAPPSPTVQNNPHKAFTQESLVAFVDVILSTRVISKKLDGGEWPLERLTRLMAILKGVLTYPNSPDYRPDVDALPPVQAIVMDAIADIDLTLPGSPSLVMRDLSEFATLPFLAAFDVAPQPGSQTPQKRVTYIALAKKTMPLLVNLFLRFKDQETIYVDGTLEAVLSAYSIPVKLKYDCPAPSKFGKDLPLWKTATNNFLRIVHECTGQVKAFGEALPDERVEGIWHQILDVFRGGILADCTAAESLSLEEQEVEENFDLVLIASLEADVVPHIGDSRVPDSLVAHLGKILQQGSGLYESLEFSASDRNKRPLEHSPTSSGGSSFERVDYENYHEIGSTEGISLVPRERFSYWCFDLLFLICSDITTEQEPSRKRLAALNLTSLLNRCRSTLVSYVADESMRGNLPFPRVREEELIYVLRKLLDLRLSHGTFLASMSDNPSKVALEQPPINTTSALSILISEAIKRSPLAHLFHFYPILCEIVSIPRKLPTTRTRVGGSNTVFASSQPNGNLPHPSVVELDARLLAKSCLQLLGKEMGVSN
ncbi:hypothetical protein BDN72DRAFT_409999 [Pluteus cervinus]|uniref:Uncharacterized protein n=1 Tax=Pluteus cervinus TaxID=181527 RepID=A0ACD3B1R2_9AGAR|nr:hypothetical protein BDN72DRAFT_409999 [Pluteus cervinus]